MKKEKKKIGIFGFIFKSIFLFMVCFTILFTVMLWSKIKMINYEFIDKSKLALNKDLLYEIENEQVDVATAKEIKDIKNILLVGSDSRGGSNEMARADTIMVFSVNPAKKSIKLLSIPRDTYVNISGKGMDKINHAYAYGKETLLLNTINSNFNTNVSDYVTINFAGLIDIVNEIGGIKMDITEEEKNYINERSHESYGMSGNAYKNVSSAGNVTLDGEQTLTHARNRTVGNDFMRQDRQRKVVASALQKFNELDLKGVLNVTQKCLSHVTTNVNVFEYLKIVPSLVAHKSEYLSNIVSAQIPSTTYSAGKKINGVYYYVPDKQRSISDFAEYIYNK